ncbi:hypothetical protein AM274_29205 [Pseudomonas nunensis]|nr:hypothetical protein AM274_29205 [Pseudomonas nunensis]
MGAGLLAKNDDAVHLPSPLTGRLSGRLRGQASLLQGKFVVYKICGAHRTNVGAGLLAKNDNAVYLPNS